jgi:hypothetical protein
MYWNTIFGVVPAPSLDSQLSLTPKNGVVDLTSYVTTELVVDQILFVGKTLNQFAISREACGA